MKADLRISVNVYRTQKHLKILLRRMPFAFRQYYVHMNGAPWPQSGRPVSLARLLTALRKALVKAT